MEATTTETTENVTVARLPVLDTGTGTTTAAVVKATTGETTTAIETARDRHEIGRLETGTGLDPERTDTASEGKS